MLPMGGSIEVVNMFIWFTFNERLDLSSLAKSLGDIEYRPGHSAGIINRFAKPKTCITLYRSGTGRCTGARSFEEAYGALAKLTLSLRELGARVKNPRLEVKNIVCTVDLQQAVDPSRLAKAFETEIEYEPEQFPAAIIRSQKNGTVLLFPSGKAIITGVKSVPRPSPYNMN